MRLSLLFLFALPLAACNGAAVADVADPEKPDARVRGEVVEVDASPMAYDGDAVVRVRTEGGEEVRVLVPARLNLCDADGLGLYAELEPGDEIEVQGRMEDGALYPCASPTHYLRRL